MASPNGSEDSPLGAHVRWEGVKRRGAAFSVVGVGLLALVVGSVWLAGSDAGRSSPESGSVEVTLPDGASPLARRSFDAMRGFPAFRTSVEQAYGAGQRCRAYGPERWTSEISADGALQVIDANVDGATDVIVDDAVVYVSRSYLPEWSSPSEWVAIRLTSGEPSALSSAAIRLEPLFWSLQLRGGAPLSTGIATAEAGAETGFVPVATEDVGGVRLTRYELRGPVAAGIQYWLEGTGVIRRVRFEDGEEEADPTSFRSATVSVETMDQRVQVSVPSPGEVTPLEDLQASDVVPSMMAFRPGCETIAPAFPASLEAELDAASELTFGEYAEQRYAAQS